MSIETQVISGELYFEEDMPESQAQINLNEYIKGMLKNQFALQNCFITGNLAIYPPVGTNYGFTNLAPDVVLFKGVSLTPAEQANLTSWKIGEPNRPAPTVVFEISSRDTWTKDLDPKPEYYRLLGVREYFAYDPQRLWQNATTQLRGWRYQNGVTIELVPDAQGRLWSEELESWLKPDGEYLRFYDQEGNLRLTSEEAAWEREAEAEQREAAARRREAEAHRKEIEARQREEVERIAKEAEQAAKEAALLQAEAERIAKEAEQAAKEAAILQAEAERAELQALLEKLRKRNIDPNTL